MDEKVELLHPCILRLVRQVMRDNADVLGLTPEDVAELEIVEPDDDQKHMLNAQVTAYINDPEFREFAALPAPPKDMAHTYARLLATSLHEQHFADQPFELCGDLYGVLLQISNMAAGLVRSGQNEYDQARRDQSVLLLAAQRLENSIKEAEKDGITLDYVDGLRDAHEALRLMAEEYFIPAQHEAADKADQEGEDHGQTDGA